MDKSKRSVSAPGTGALTLLFERNYLVSLIFAGVLIEYQRIMPSQATTAMPAASSAATE